ncbi:hypothetical protein B0T10DRAFT_258917 [Thelonectria olida]|uniref:DUF7735 domain-containing protein n=1 Tax=Thelonectria olida TaxID=1576542 RepID=A0A9P8WBH6_9HYPO|nr:hypothetical protein B0T10DRAFT_258917 [Thelonectria olida]
MQSKIILATTLLAAVASADNFMVHPQMRRDLEARATATATSPFDDCQLAIFSAYSDVPTPPSAIISDALEHPQTDPCDFTTPASLSKEYKSYSSEIMSWYTDHSKEIADAVSSCPSLSQYASIVPTCNKNGDSKATATATSGSKSADSTKASDDSEKTGAASHNTGMAAAAMAAAGFVVALL